MVKAGAAGKAVELAVSTRKRTDSVELCLPLEGWDAVYLFQRCTTQWNKGFAGLEGLNYDGVRAVAEMLNIKLDAPMLDRLQTMENAVLQEARKRV